MKITKNLIFFLVIVTFSLPALSETSGIQIPGLSSSNESLSRSYETPLSAYTFYDPIHENNPNPRGTDWPDQLTFLPDRPRTAEDVGQLLKGNWSVRFHCDRKAVEAAFLAGELIQDGYIRDRVQYIFENNQFVKRVFSPSASVNDSPKRELFWDYKVQRALNSTDEFEIVITTPQGNERVAWKFKLEKVEETGETIFSIPMDRYEDIGICPSGSRVKFILAPESPLMS